jgi:hypothetical protein
MNAKQARLVAIAVLALVAAAALSTVAVAGPGKQPAGLTGVWSGKTHQDIEPLGDDGEIVEYEQRITIRAIGGRLTYVGVNVRYTCPLPDNPMVGDMSLDLGRQDLGDQAKLRQNGGFTVNVTQVRNAVTGKLVKLYVPVHFTGVLRKHGASGSFSIGNSTCAGKGTWQAKRKS